ncbi:MAG: M56 family metallopeptidase [bacterium]|jgi:beta-lactamase regulating signal transducer with metallopeptidase domain
MSFYFLSPNTWLLFILAWIFTVVLRRYPYVAYGIWLAVLIKLLIPVELVHLSLENILHTLNVEYVQELSADTKVESSLPSFSTTDRFNISQVQKKAAPGVLPFEIKIASESIRLTMKDGFNGAKLSFFISCFWILGSVVAALKIFYDYQKIKRIIRRGSEISSGERYERFVELAATLGMKRIPRLVVTDELECSAFSYGSAFHSGVVVFPAPLLDENNPQLFDMIVCHELVHLQRKHYWISYLRALALVVFHIHPIRWISDRHLDFYQEIITDEHAIRTLNTDRQHYIENLLRLAVPFQYFEGKSPLYSSLLYLNPSDVERFWYLQILHHPKSRIYPLLLLLCLTLTIPAFAIHFTALPVITTCTIFIDENQAVPLPSPLYSYPHVNHDTDAKMTLQGTRLWVLESKRGLFVYELINTFEPILLDAYKVDTGTDELFSDFTLYGEYVYLGRRGCDDHAVTPFAVEILQWDEKRQKIIKLNELMHCDPFHVFMQGDHLIVTGRRTCSREGSVKLYEVSHPEMPLLMQEECFPALPSHFVPVEGNRFIISAADHVYVYTVEDEISLQQVISLDITPMGMLIPRDGSLLISGASLGLENNLSEQLFYLFAADERGNYELQSKTDLILSGKIRGMGYLNAAMVNDFLLLSYPKYSLLLKLAGQHLEFGVLFDSYVGSMKIQNNYLLSVLPRMNVFDTGDLLLRGTLILE